MSNDTLNAICVAIILYGFNQKTLSYYYTTFRSVPRPDHM